MAIAEWGQRFITEELQAQNVEGESIHGHRSIGHEPIVEIVQSGQSVSTSGKIPLIVAPLKIPGTSSLGVKMLKGVGFTRGQTFGSFNGDSGLLKSDPEIVILQSPTPKVVGQTIDFSKRLMT